VSSLSHSHIAAMVEFGRQAALGQAALNDVRALLKCYQDLDPDIKWNGGLYLDSSLKERSNVFLIYQDTYIFGRGFLGTTELKVPVKYKAVRQGDVLNRPVPWFSIAIVTGDMDQGAEDVIGAQEMIRRYGSADSGGLIKHVIYPNESLEEPKAVSDLIAGLADDPLIRVIVVNQAVQGTAEGFRRAKAKRPEILCLAGEPHEPPDVISQISELTVHSDFISRGYLIPYAAKSLGADSLVHVSFDRHMANETMKLRSLIMKEACRDLGLKYFEEKAPDPAGGAGVDGARDFIVRHYPQWVKKYGTKAVFFPTNDAHTEPLLKQMALYGGYFIEADIPSTLLGYPGAFNVNIEPHLGQWNQILEIVENAVVESGGSGRMGVWAYPLGFTQTAGLVEFGKLLVEERASVTDINTFLQCLGMFTPGARWNGSFLNDTLTGRPLRNYFLIYQDTYIFGQGYIETTKLEVPDKYYSIKLNAK
jgi:hypothetical protein